MSESIAHDSNLNNYVISDDFDFLWDPTHRIRARELSSKYGSESIRVWLRYVIEGGARDMYEFTCKYAGRFKYARTKAWNNQGTDEREEYYQKIRMRMQSISQEPHFTFLYCPFMKKRALELVDAGVNYDRLSSILSYTMTGSDCSLGHDDDKFNYLRRMGIY